VNRTESGVDAVDAVHRLDDPFGLVCHHSSVRLSGHIRKHPETMTPQRIEIRAAALEDAALLAELGARTFTEGFPSTNPTDLELHIASEYSVEAIEADFVAGRFVIASAGGEDAGYAFLRADEAHEAVLATDPIELNRIYVLQKWVGRGIGDALMERCLADARGAGCDVIWLGTWDQNARAIRFYEKWGFEKVGTQNFLLGTDLQSDIVMARPV
jgi:GNAT superfamily N-acetyltransferase